MRFLLSYLGSLIICWLAFRKAETLKSKFYGFPVYRVGLIYTIVQFFASLAIFIIGAFIETPFWVSIVVSVMLLVLAVLGTIVSDNMREVVEQIEASEMDSTRQMANIQNTASDILDMCKVEDVRIRLTELVNKIKYSDPVSSEATCDAELKILEKLELLKTILTNSEESISCIEDIINLLASRNRICKSNK